MNQLRKHLKYSSQSTIQIGLKLLCKSRWIIVGFYTMSSLKKSNHPQCKRENRAKHYCKLQIGRYFSISKLYWSIRQKQNRYTTIQLGFRDWCSLPKSYFMVSSGSVFRLRLVSFWYICQKLFARRLSERSVVPCPSVIVDMAWVFFTHFIG